MSGINFPQGGCTKKQKKKKKEHTQIRKKMFCQIRQSDSATPVRTRRTSRILESPEPSSSVNTRLPIAARTAADFYSIVTEEWKIDEKKRKNEFCYFESPELRHFRRHVTKSSLYARAIYINREASTESTINTLKVEPVNARPDSATRKTRS